VRGVWEKTSGDPLRSQEHRHGRGADPLVLQRVPCGDTGLALVKARIILSEDDGFVIADVFEQGGMLLDLLIRANMQLGQYLAGYGVAALREAEEARATASKDSPRCTSTYMRQRCVQRAGHKGTHSGIGPGGQLCWDDSATEVRYRP
jgi:hypothetical protein